jgi:signal transduction histidine kinase
MTVPATGILPARPPDSELACDLLHALSQPVTTLECGLELALRQNETVAQLRARLESLLGTAQLLHQRLIEVRALQEAGDAGDTTTPVAVDVVLSQLQEDFLPVASTAKVEFSMRCSPAPVHGNAQRLRNGFFQLIDFLLKNCPSPGALKISVWRREDNAVEVRFRSQAPDGAAPPVHVAAAITKDPAVRIAQRTFQAAGGNMALTQRASGQIIGCVRLLRAT